MRPFVLMLLGLAACPGGARFQLINLERPGDDVGLRPPADYAPCYAGKAEGIDTNDDGKPDYVRVRDDSGRNICVGSDSNHNGRIDTWDVLDKNGQVTQRAHDSNEDGKPDQTWVFDPNRPGCAMIHPDVNGDGKPDPVAPIDLCRQLGPRPAVDGP